MRPALLAAALAVAALAGCGGDDGPTAAERRAAYDRWVQQADAACRRAESEIVQRGEPQDAVDVDRVVVRAAADLRRAAESIRRLRVPPGAEKRVRPVLAALDGLEEPLKSLEEWSAVGKQDELVDAASEWRLESKALEIAARDAGLSDCGRPGQAEAAADAIIAPVYAGQFLELMHAMVAELRALPENRAGTRAGAMRYARGMIEVVQYTLARMQALEPPRRAANEAGAYEESLEALLAASRRAQRTVRRVPVMTRARLVGIDRRFDRAAAEMRRTGRRLGRALRPRAGRPAAEGEEEIEA